MATHQYAFTENGVAPCRVVLSLSERRCAAVLFSMLKDRRIVPLLLIFRTFSRSYSRPAQSECQPCIRTASAFVVPGSANPCSGSRYGRMAPQNNWIETCQLPFEQPCLADGAKAVCAILPEGFDAGVISGPPARLILMSA